MRERAKHPLSHNYQPDNTQKASDYLSKSAIDPDRGSPALYLVQLCKENNVLNYFCCLLFSSQLRLYFLFSFIFSHMLRVKVSPSRKVPPTEVLKEGSLSVQSFLAYYFLGEKIKITKPLESNLVFYNDSLRDFLKCCFLCSACFYGNKKTFIIIQHSGFCHLDRVICMAVIESPIQSISENL